MCKTRKQPFNLIGQCHIGIDPYTRRGLIHTILDGKLTRSIKLAITTRKIQGVKPTVTLIGK
jgi:hypothetical protein